MSNDLAAADDEEPRRAQSHRFDRIGRLQQHHVGMGADGKAVAFEPENPRGDLGHRVERPADGLAARHGRAMNGHMRNIEHVCAAEPIPRIHHAILPERDGTPSARISAMRVSPRRRG